VATRQDVVVTFADGSTEKCVWDSAERWQRYSWVKPARAVSAEIDPANRHMLDASSLDNSLTVEPDTSASRRWAGDLSALIQSVVTALGSL
jgi:hypothetical protein